MLICMMCALSALPAAVAVPSEAPGGSWEAQRDSPGAQAAEAARHGRLHEFDKDYPMTAWPGEEQDQRHASSSGPLSSSSTRQLSDASSGVRPKIYVYDLEQFRVNHEAWTWIHKSLYGLEVVRRRA